MASSAIEKYLRESSGALTNDVVVYDAAVRFYSARNHEPAWGAQEDTARLLDAIGKTGDVGLNPKDYIPEDFDCEAATDPADIAKRDITLTAAFFELARDLRVGRARPPADPPAAQWQPAVPDLVPELQAALADHDFAGRFAGLEPT